MYAFIYSRKKYKRAITVLTVAWAVQFTIRCALYIYFGPEFVYTSGNRIMAVLGSGCLGAIICLMVIKRKSAPVPKKPVE